jgi:hypothetical protein
VPGANQECAVDFFSALTLADAEDFRSLSMLPKAGAQVAKQPDLRPSRIGSPFLWGD